MHVCRLITIPHLAIQLPPNTLDWCSIDFEFVQSLKDERPTSNIQRPTSNEKTNLQYRTFNGYLCFFSALRHSLFVIQFPRRDGCFDFGFWIADFGFPGNQSFFEESEFNNVRYWMFVFSFDVGRWMFDVGRSSFLNAQPILRQAPCSLPPASLAGLCFSLPSSAALLKRSGPQTKCSSSPLDFSRDQYYDAQKVIPENIRR